MARRFLVTGGCGFIGSNFVRLVLSKHPDVDVTNLDKLTYAGNPENLIDLADHPRYHFMQGDIADPETVAAAFERGVDVVVNFAAESHVDRSIADASPFVRTNIQGTQVLLDAARARGVRRFVQISTDEVYGSLGPTGFFTEETPLSPNSPYSASKAAADLLAKAYQHTFGLPVLITRCSNNYGPYQYPEKLIPLFVTNLLADKPVPVYGRGENVRDWIYVEDHCRGILAAIERGRPGEVYNFGGNAERRNIDITRLILRELGKPESLVTYVQDRPGHDLRYAIDAAKAKRDLGWEPRVPFEDGIRRTIRWYVERPDWWGKLKRP